MHFSSKHFIPILFIFFACSLLDFGVLTEQADARSRSGGRSFKQSRSVSPAPSRTTPSTKSAQQSNSGGFMRGMAGGLVGGAIGSMLFGSLAHAGAGGGLGGSGIGLFQILILGGIGYFVYSRFFKKKAPSYAQYQPQENPAPGIYSFPGHSNSFTPPPFSSSGTVEDGLAMIRQSEPDFDPQEFKEIAQDVFFQVQAGWMRRDITSYQHLLDAKLAGEYEGHFAEMRKNGQINKLENIAVRSVDLVDAGMDGNEEFVSLLFKANLLDYTVDENSGAVVEGSMTTPVKFAEQWTWTRMPGQVDWKLAGVDIKSA
ncbi:MAG: Tim44 domain-containing protein [Desulfobulbaceae bacterium]|nr:Tim44 domain-containing protein [Desulfobulbaceae bacterium]